MSINRIDPTISSNYVFFPYVVKTTKWQQTAMKVAAIIVHIALSIFTFGIYAAITTAKYFADKRKVTVVQTTNTPIGNVENQPVEPTACEKIQKLIEKGKIFKPVDGREVKQVFYNRNVGVFLHAQNSTGNDIYYAKEAEEFAKCKSNIQSWEKTPARRTECKVKLPGKLFSGTLEFDLDGPQPHIGEDPNSFVKRPVLWNKAPLESITV